MINTYSLDLRETRISDANKSSFYELRAILISNRVLIKCRLQKGKIKLKKKYEKKLAIDVAYMKT